MVPLARRLLFRNRGGFVVTVAGVAATVSLLLFLFAVHAGVRDGSTRYVRTAGVDVWIAQNGSDNIIKSSSFVPASLAARVAARRGRGGFAFGARDQQGGDRRAAHVDAVPVRLRPADAARRAE